MSWLPLMNILLQGISTVAEQWFVAGAEEKAAIEKRCMQAVHDMISTREATKVAHDARTAETEAIIDKAKG